MMNKMSITNEIKNNLNQSFFHFNQYILTNAEESKRLYKFYYDKAVEDVMALQQDSDIRSKYILRDLLNSLGSFKEAADRTIEIYDDRSGVDVYYDEYVWTKEIVSYCNTFISMLSDSYFDYNVNIYKGLKQKQDYINRVLMAYIIVALMLSAIYTLLFIGDITRKLKELVSASEKVVKGDFTYHEGERTYIYELDILSEAFRKMITYISKYIESLQEKAELERKLQDEKMKLLRYENALKVSQLKILQAQINPHFLFNTLNCISQTAVKENAHKTESLIRAVAGILRYSLSMMDRNATLEEEVNIVKQYMYIQKIRYEDRFEFNLKINVDLKKVVVPAMTLQPFVENAFIHGIEPKEEGGVINIEITEQGSFCTILIEDTGCGMDEGMLKEIMSDSPEQRPVGHTTGLGIRSVVQRLKLMYGRDDIFSIESKKGFGTRVYLKIPIKE
ncbi:sensor histidine kinase [Caldicoprobacter algeriensis]|uniref:sensor histidine kinase n=1 Tax=Caldicoprobacter algeriensis TaxID=699281 RepID=UPI002079DBFE|nr:histidine kinase [Caldicoprobacter algeriensis]